MKNYKGATIRLTEHWRLDELPRMSNAVIDGGGEFGIHLAEGAGGGDLVLHNITLRNVKHLWVHAGAVIDWIDIAGLRILNSLSGVQIDAPSLGGGRVRDVVVQNLQSDGKVAGLWFGYNSTQQPELPPIIVQDFNACALRTTGGKECHALASFAQPIHVSDFDIAGVRGGDAAEAIYTKSSHNVFTSGRVADSDGQGAIALKGRGVEQYAEGSVISASVSIENDKAVWIQADNNIVRPKTSGIIKQHKTLATGNVIDSEAE